VKGTLPDLTVCDGRKVYILLDSNAGTQPKVQAAERAFVAELRSRKSDVLVCRIPVRDGVNGPDDLIAVAGDDAMADVIAAAKDPETTDIAGGIPVYSEGNLARRFAEIHGETLRYTAQWDQWNIYDGCCWSPDLKLSVLTMANQLCHEAAGAIANPVIARSVDALRTSTAVQTLARILAPIPALAAQWDSDIWLLNTPNGAINLKLGDKDAFELRAGREADYCTKMTAAAPGGQCPVFLQFMHETTGGDKDLEAYLQMLFG
jgi:putative DNA primase/helicase